MVPLMRTIRGKIILLFLVIVLLPAAPTIYLVGDLVHQSYQVGVNPQVEQALQRGVEFSREVYRLRKQHLSERLAEVVAAAGDAFRRSPPPESSLLPESDDEWRYLAIQVYDPGGRLRWQQGDTLRMSRLSPEHLSEVNQTAGGRMVIGDRRANRFMAIQRLDAPPGGYAVLAAALDSTFLARSDALLRVYQVYRALSLSSASIPGSFLIAFLTINLTIVLATVLIAIWLSRRFTEPLQELVKGTQEIGRGNLDYRIPRRSTDEVGEVVDHFNRMAARLQELQEKTIFLERMAAWQEIARRVAHEIKNPLTPIQLTLQEMVDRYHGGDPEYARLLRECHQIINEELESLRRLVSEFSQFGRLPELNIRMNDLHRIIEEVQGLYPHRNIRLHLDEAVPWLPLDADRIRQVLINLVENAIEADPQNRPIDISTRRKGDWVEVEVEDRGAGIPRELQGQIFRPYFSTRKQGTGLGLAIARKMIEEHGGSISVESHVGEGTRFRFRLPVRSPK
ncbi:MAG: HAMP domain-containing protein [Calditrichaeota bacterium]|nr:MAG: HAMP domain-containing protein [Calditrichota bacterium]